MAIYLYISMRDTVGIFKLKELYDVLRNMALTAKIYFRTQGKKKSAIINVSGDIDSLKMENGDSLIVRVEDDGTKIVMKTTESVKI